MAYVNVFVKDLARAVRRRAAIRRQSVVAETSPEQLGRPA
jgi:hypothetical protein